MISIGEEAGVHRAAVLALHCQAFGGTFEAGLVARLHEEGLVASSLVAVAGSEVVGHILFSDLAVRVDGRDVAAVALAPMAVRPDCQRRGIGTRLVRAGLAAARSKGREAVIVVGHPAYYPRFGFSPALAGKLASPYAGAAFMALELVPGALRGKEGSVAYPDAFSA
jgi:putative acetyltransferase